MTVLFWGIKQIFLVEARVVRCLKVTLRMLLCSPKENSFLPIMLCLVFPIDLTDTWLDYILSYHRSALFSQEPIFMLATNPLKEGFSYTCVCCS